MDTVDVNSVYKHSKDICDSANVLASDILTNKEVSYIDVVKILDTILNLSMLISATHAQLSTIKKQNNGDDIHEIRQT